MLVDSRVDVGKYSFFQRTINVWSKFSTDCVDSLFNYRTTSIIHYLLFFIKVLDNFYYIQLLQIIVSLLL